MNDGRENGDVKRYRNSESQTDDKRRNVLLALGGIGTFGLAGCSEQSNTDASSPTSNTETASPSAATTEMAETVTETETTEETKRPPSVELASVSTTPDPPRQYQPVTLEVTLENTGGTAFEGTSRFGFDSGTAESDSETSGEPVAVSIPAGETMTQSVETTWKAVGETGVTVTVETDREVVMETTGTVDVRRYPEHTVGVDGTNLTCGDGTVYYAGGSPTLAFDPALADPKNVEVSFASLSENDATSARVWAYSPRWSDVSSIPEPYTYSDAFFEHFDHVVAAAKKRDIRLFAALFNGNPAYGPKGPNEYGTNVPQFVAWADDAEEYNDFFDSDDCMEMYKDWVRELLTHENHITGVEYRNDPTIAMWELGNEIQRSPPDVGTSIRSWVEEAGAFVKSLDDETLLTTGSYGHQGRNAYVDEASADPIDVASIHYYPGPHHYDVPKDRVPDILRETIETTHQEVGKPLLVGEYNWGVDTDATTPLEERNRQLKRIHDVFDENDVAATSIWHTVAWKRTPGDTKNTTVHLPSDDGTTSELQRYIDLTESKSTSECLPEDGSS